LRGAGSLLRLIHGSPFGKLKNLPLNLLFGLGI
jgi:hypothetical protein